MTNDINNIEDPEVKELMGRMTELVYPKLNELQDLFGGDKKPGMIKMMKIVKDFSKNLRKEYKEKYDRDLDTDIKKINEHIGIDSPMNFLNMFKNK